MEIMIKKADGKQAKGLKEQSLPINLTDELLKKQQEIDNLLDLAKELLQENEQLKIINIHLTQKLRDAQNLQDGYNEKWTWVSKIIFALKTENRPLKAMDMVELFGNYEPPFAKRHNKVKFLSAFLVKAQGYERITAINIKGVRGFYYCLPEWVNKEGHLNREMEAKIF